MMKGLKRLAAGGILLREVRGIRQELARIAAAMEHANAYQFPPRPQAPEVEGLSATEITFVNTPLQAELMEIESGLYQAGGLPPSEDQVLEEYHRRHGDQG